MREKHRCVNKRAPLVLGFLLLAFGLLKAVMSWPYVPIWYHVIFTALLIPMTIMGGKLLRRLLTSQARPG